MADENKKVFGKSKYFCLIFACFLRFCFAYFTTKSKIVYVIEKYDTNNHT